MLVSASRCSPSCWCQLQGVAHLVGVSFKVSTGMTHWRYWDRETERDRGRQTDRQRGRGTITTSHSYTDRKLVDASEYESASHEFQSRHSQTGVFVPMIRRPTFVVFTCLTCRRRRVHVEMVNIIAPHSQRAKSRVHLLPSTTVRRCTATSASVESLNVACVSGKNSPRLTTTAKS